MVQVILDDFPHVDRVLWWDDDNWPQDIAMVQRMIDKGEDFIAGGYTTKKQPLHWVHRPLDHNPLPDDEKQLLEVARCGFGFTMTSRSCLQRMWDSADHYIDYRSGGKFEVANVFGMMIGPMPDGGTTLLSEDYSFCDRWRALGGKVWMYQGPGNVLFHGGGHAWGPSEMAGCVIR